MKQIVLCILIALCLAACATTATPADPAEIYKGYSDEQLYNLGNNANCRKKYSEAIKYFEALNALYPFGTFTEKAQSKLIYAYYESGEYASAIASASQFIRLYPRAPHVDYAYYIKGLSQLELGKNVVQKQTAVDYASRDLTNTKEAFFSFRDLVQLHPNSLYAPDARQHMVAINNMLARYELQVAEFYMKRKAYVAAANRASYVIENYQHTPEVKKALVLLAEANCALGLPQAEGEARRVLQMNYPVGA
jgi:outer membrane protein assembly factor BamD